MNNKSAIRDELQKSPLLGYKLGPPAQDYYIGPVISIGEETALTKERLIIDIVNHILQCDIEPLKEIVDSLVLFYQLIYRISTYEPELETPIEHDIFNITSSYTLKYLDRVNNDIFPMLIPYDFSWNDSGTKASGDDRLYILSKNKVKRYPDMQSVLHYVENMASKIGYEAAGTVLAGLYILVDQKDNALKVYEEMQRIGSMSEYDHYNAGTIYLQCKNSVEARKHLETSDIEEARYHIGMMYMYDENWDLAAEYFSELAKDYNSSYQSGYIETVTLSQFISQFSWNNLGICCYRDTNKGSIRKRASEALGSFQKAVLWKSATLRPDGEDNAQQITEIMRSIVSEYGKMPKADRRHKEFPNIIGNSKAMQKVYGLIEEAANTDINVLITGASGTGKEEVAMAIHYSSSRKSHPFIPLDCAAIPEKLLESELFGHEKGAFTGATKRQLGKFELADRGTIFLDEIGEMKKQLQAKLLRVVEDRKITRIGGTQTISVDVRILCATNKDLEKAISGGKFRNDLYQRIRGIEIELPSLDKRKEDIPALANHLIEKYITERNNKGQNLIKPELSDPALEKLMSHNWSDGKLSGNVRELGTAIESAVNRVTMEGREIIYTFDIKLPTDKNTERSETIEALQLERWKVTRAAKRLGITPQAVYKRLKKYDISAEEECKKMKKL